MFHCNALELKSSPQVEHQDALWHSAFQPITLILVISVLIGSELKFDKLEGNAIVVLDFYRFCGAPLYGLANLAMSHRLIFKVWWWPIVLRRIDIDLQSAVDVK